MKNSFDFFANLGAYSLVGVILAIISIIIFHGLSFLYDNFGFGGIAATFLVAFWLFCVGCFFAREMS